jgi:Asp-tRNA(Asn)/Glu-tRNA(Gln) amidotransferase A subunit family amidase
VPADITDDPEYFRDAPISLQVIGKKYEEEAVIR